MLIIVNISPQSPSTTDSKKTAIPKIVLQPKIIRGTNGESSKISTRIKTLPRTDQIY